MDEEMPTDHAAACDQLEQGNLAEPEEAAMAKRLEVWVQRHLACLPKSESRLLRALRTDLCSVKRQVWTADAVFDRLVRLGHIEVVADETTAPARADEADNQEDCRPRNRHSERPQMARERAPGRSGSDRRPRPARQLQPRVRVQLIFHAWPEVRVESEGGADDELEEAAVVMEKVMRWVERQEANPQQRPTSVEAAKRSLAQLCFVNVGFQPERLVELLAAKNYLRLDQTNEEDSKVEKKVVWLLKQTVAGGVEGKRKSEEVGDQDKEHQEESKTGTDATENEEKQDSRKRMRSL
ncbi:uncharacterized protein ACA1_249100 [Acanthamoeba castellanii str. Neff]|uniref:Uncharacterized protein n=1 Tax=Acanthamoeba castellanii (strain ATCC 30010 / Neff) TaxID=1257118 RepID=L8GXY4_ACACF|nr:uncharacterized protein ACA1_249100 [Acanthamoeba castellanii str. Neff]ELR17865.1 hypothetical protein ACA1_249100 [Acanthamoeba castellanii str. Neff]